MKTAQTDKFIEKCDEVAGLLKYLSHPQRLILLCKIAESPKTVGQLQESCGLSQSLTSQFLAKMKAEGLISSEKDGKYVTYHILDERILKLMSALQKVFCP